MNNIIQVENLSKKYIIGHQQLKGKKTFREAISQSFVNFGSKFSHPFSKNISSNSPYEEFWALKDISFEVEQGDRIGIIGRNGAGKSTLLKVLSRITEPSSGKITIKGRVASLLEVGTGFNGELTGRENIFLNGAILGMHRAEIKQKFDEIVDFSGVEKFLDTPVKRYSSGMYVRLAFAVAAHLESEIMIVDEVLAVGDAEFQKKCLGKMGEVSKGEGRTVLFVSHNMGAMLNLCDKGILLGNGQVVKTGTANDVVEEYLSSSTIKSSQVYSKRFGNKKAEFLDYKLSDSKGSSCNNFFMGDDIFVHLRVKFHEKIAYAEIGLNIKNSMGELFTHVANFDDGFIIKSEAGKEREITIKLCNIYFSPSTYFFDIAIVSGMDHYDMIEGCLPFTLFEGEKIKRGNFPKHIRIFTQSKWNWDA